MEKHREFEGVYFAQKQGKRAIATKSLVKGFQVHDEPIVKEGGEEYRLWDPKRSKLAAAILKGLHAWPFKPGVKILYLGAANGVTPSFVSDIIGPKSKLYALEFSARAMRDLLRVCETRENMLPLLEDARLPQRYEKDLEPVDVIYEDVADRDQAQILVENSKLFLKKSGIAMLAIKARSIDAVAPPKQVYSKVITQLQPHFIVKEKIDLFPFERDHLFLVLEKK